MLMSLVLYVGVGVLLLLPATQAVVKHDIFAWNITRNMSLDTKGLLGSQTTSHTPTAMAIVDKLQNPHKAYVPNALLRSCRTSEHYYRRCAICTQRFTPLL